jgi:basic amino acid/polyamine antiporter, APA family
VRRRGQTLPASYYEERAGLCGDIVTEHQRRTKPGLSRSVGATSLFATAYGNVGSSIYYALGLVAAHALGLTPLVFLLAGGLFALTAQSYAEGAAMLPEAGGSSSFARHAFNEVVSFLAGWALILDYLITIAISAFFVPHYLGPLLPVLREGPGDVVAAAVVIGLLAAVNRRGLGESAGLNVGLAVVDIATQAAIIVIGAALVLDPARLVEQVHLGVAPTWHELLFGVSISMVAYTGVETIANMAEEERDPGRDVPRSARAVVISVITLYVGITTIGLSALPVERVPGGGYATELGTTYATDPILGIVSGLDLGALTPAAKTYVGFLAATILLIAANAGLIGVSRLAWSLAEHHQLPRRFGALHARRRTPTFAIAAFSALAVALVLPGSADFLGNLYSFGALLSFTIAHASIVALRLRRPDLERPYRAGWNVSIDGRPVPLTAVVGGLGTAAAWISVVVLHGDARVLGGAWMILGLAGYLAYRSALRLKPRELHRRGLEPPDRLARFTREPGGAHAHRGRTGAGRI